METLVNDKLLDDKNTASSATTTLSHTTSPPYETAERKSIRVSGPVKPYHPRLKNFWYPVAFSNDLKDDTLVSH